jgi:hypothetical protein
MCAGGRCPPHTGGPRCQTAETQYPNRTEAAGGRGAGESTFDRAKPIALGLMLAALAVAVVTFRTHLSWDEKLQMVWRGR